ncbi:CLIP-associating protein 1-like isoform X4 [Asterias rubens]|uniref:CLIP-associating protein 1-like isoform X4 n=1 Tax=Asterias rubens TaxID=7604 RepID=UPI001455A4E0|nr:CLIP-associating protein 1-like isoform X4 [Asterias rubens]
MADLTLDEIAAQIMKQDTHSRLQASHDFQMHLSDESNPLVCESFDRLVDGLVGWVNCSNFKVSLCGLECLTCLVDRMEERFKSHIGSVLPAVVDRLGDGKDQVREQAQALIQKMMCPAAAPQYVFERLMKGFSHKGWRVREEILLCLMQTINVFGAGTLSLNKIVPSICKLLGDPNSQVRDTAINTLVEIYRHVGEKVRIDLGKKGIPSSRLSIIYAKFDDVHRAGQMLVVTPEAQKPSSGGDEPDSKTDTLYENEEAGQKSYSKRATSTLGRKTPSSSRASSASPAGSVDEDSFFSAFEEVPTQTIYNNRGLEDDLNKITEILKDEKIDWEIRTNTLKKVRSLFIAGAPNHDCFLPCLRSMEEAFIFSVKDLRSQVVREACITLAFLAVKLGRQFDHVAEMVLPSLFQLLQNSAKVMATSGSVCLSIILKYNHSSRLIPIFKTNITSKSVAIRRQSCQFLSNVLTDWETHPLEKHVNTLSECLRKGIEDPDSDTRVVARKAFWKFSEHFRSHADKLFQSLDPSKQKAVQGEMSSASSSGSLSSKSLSRASSSGSQENVNSTTLPRRSIYASRSTRRKTTEIDGSKNSTLGQRSSSEVNLAAASRSRSRYASNTSAAGMAARLPRSKSTSRENLLGSGGRKRAATTPGRSAIPTPNGRTGRTKSRIGVSQSQPGSRTNSRSSSPSTLRLPNLGVNGSAASAARRRNKSGIPVPRSQGASREASPSRYQFASRDRRLSNSSNQAQREANHKGNILTQRVLEPGQDAETALALALEDEILALGGDSDLLDIDHELVASIENELFLRKVQSQQAKATRRRWDSYSDDESETSSVCSVGSFGSGRDRALEDVSEVLNKMASPGWSERKEGLIGMQNVLQSSRPLSRAELKRAQDIFTRMFADAHSKVFSLFLETVVEFVIVHKSELSDWLFILMTRLLLKMGADLLGSVLHKVQRALDVVREAFPYDHQFKILTRFIVDQTQTPNNKVKVALLRYIENLSELMDPSQFTNSSETRLAVSRIISWTKEAKNPDVRKASQSVLISLFELNTPEFSSMLSVLPKTFQDGATKLLHNHLRNATVNENESIAVDLQRKASPRSPYKASPRSTDSSPRGSYASNGPPEFDTENMNSEDIYDSLRRTTAEIQSFTYSSRDDLDAFMKEGHRVDSDEVSADSGITSSMTDVRVDSPQGKVKAYPEFSPARNGSVFIHAYQQQQQQQQSIAKTPPATTPSPSSVTHNSYNPSIYQDNGISDTRLTVTDGAYDDDILAEGDHVDILVPLLTELSNHNQRFEERRTAMMQLIKLTRSESVAMWDNHFKTVLLLMLETLGDVEASIRAMALRVLREILRNQPDRFKDYAELTILKILEAHKDAQSEVVRAAEETSATLAHSIAPEQCVRVLCPIIQTADYPINQAAIKMLTKVLELMPGMELEEIVSEVVPVLLKSYDHNESSVRKASVFCLVAIHTVIGERLKDHLGSLSGSKTKLLNLYIKRAQSEKQTSVPSPNSPSALSSGSR